VASNLKKQLSFIDVFSLAAGAMISSGIFILPGLAFAQTGPAVVISYVLAGILALTGVFSVAELSTAMPKAGGDYYYVNRSMGPMLGTISGVMSWFALSLKTAFAIFGIAEVMHLMTGYHIIPISVVVCIFFIGLNIFGVKEAAKFEVILVFSLLLMMAAYIILGLSHVKVTNFEPFLTGGFNSVLLTSGFVFVSFGGLLKVSSVAEEVQDPQWNIPFGMITAVIVVTGMYALLLIVTVGVLPGAELKSSLTPVADAARIFSGNPGFYAITIAAMLAFITTANAGILSASRYPMALSRDNLLPESMSKVSPRFNTPIRSVLITGVFIILSLFLPLEMLVKAASTVVLTSYLLANVAIIILRESKLHNYRPSFKSPLYPWIQLVSIVIFTLLIVDMGMVTVEISMGLIVAALLLYFFYGKNRANGEYALLHLIARLGNKELSSYDLESELKAIVHHRDEIVNDDFDKIVAKAEVFDFENKMSKDELFEKLVEHLSNRFNLKQSELLHLLKEREAECSTVLIPTVAVPHIIINGENIFDLLLIRCKEGVYFSDKAPAVKAIFMIVGTKDNRRLHLLGLAAIAQTIQCVEFERRWEEARSDNNLRDIFLLSNRQRF
jgi:amino acid transporter/mannitol/fructose-specific phosphotransferase system IIA component (Ntr-type)